jgi:4-amino-4-deoxy-L-arabinose transferase-like glycosyltransferase
MSAEQRPAGSQVQPAGQHEPGSGLLSRSDLQLDSAAPLAEAQAVARPSVRDRTAIWLGLLLLATLLKGVLWVFLIYPLDAPDEPSHFNHVMQIHRYHELPAILLLSPTYAPIPPSTRQDGATYIFLQHYGFNAFRSVPYESSQPPLYYVAGALMVAPLGEDRLTLMYAVRLLSVLFGVGAVLALWWGVRVLWPETPFLWWAAALAFTLTPEFTFITSTITNDAAVLFFGALLFAVWSGGLRAARRDSELSMWKWGLLAGAVTALGLLSKLTMAVTIPCTALWLWWLAWGQGVTVAPRLRAFVVGAVTSAAAVVAGVGWWVARNLSLYGEPTGTRSVFNVYHKIYWTRRGFPLNQPFSFFPLTPGDDPQGGFVLRTFASTWATFGWNSVFVGWWAYVAVALLSVAAVVGLVRAWRAGLGERLTEAAIAHRRLAWLAAGAIAVAFAMLLAYNSLVDYQPQGRYLSVAFAPMMLLLVAGLLHTTTRSQVNKALVWGLLGLLLVMQVLSVLALVAQGADLASQQQPS